MKKEDFTPKEWELMQDYMKYAPKEPRANLIQLIGNIDPREMEKGADSWAYIFWNRQLSDDQVDFLLNFKLRVPLYMDELAAKADMTVREAALMADELAHIGIIEYWADEKGVERVTLPIFCVGSFEQAMGNDWRMQKYPEMTVAFTHYTTESSTTNGPYLPMSNHGVHRVVPVEASIENETRRADWEEISTLIENSGDIYAVSKCVCRKMSEQRGKAAGETDYEWCLSIGHFADYLIRTGKGKKITKEQFLEKIKQAEERGFVHNISNANGTMPIEYICNCDYQTCYTIRAAMYSHNPSLCRSNFVAEVDETKCMACGSCTEVCPANAVRLGQKLPDKISGEIVYEDSKNPHNELIWGAEHHDPDFLLHRENTWSETGTAPCKSNCPAHIGIAGYMQLAARGKYREALELIKKDNPFPAICGSICNRRCEHVCTRGSLDEAVAIDEVKKFVAWQELKEENRYVPKKIHNKGHKIAVIGSGPAGLSCVYYLAVLGHDVTVFEKEGQLGGMLRYGIPSFHLEKEIIDAEIDVLRKLGVTFSLRIEIGKDRTIEELRQDGFKAFYLAIGAQAGRRLNIAGEDADGVMTGLDFMRRAAFDEKDLSGGNVVVIGGGNVAVDIARTAVRCGAGSVRMFCLESREMMPASPDEIAQAEEEGIQICPGWGPKEITGQDGKVKAIQFKKCLNTLDEQGRFRPEYDEKETCEETADLVITCAGQVIDWGGLLKNSEVEIRENRTVIADPFTYQTKEKDIFAGGDVYTGPKFAIDAIAAGKQGAQSLHRFVWGHDLRRGRDRLDYHTYMDADQLDLSQYDTAKREKAEIDVKKKLTFMDDRKIFTPEQVRKETSRCLHCGKAHVDHGMCLGCGVCTTRCKFDAIHLKKVFDCTPVPRERLGADVGMEIARRKELLAGKMKEKEETHA